MNTSWWEPGALHEDVVEKGDATSNCIEASDIVREALKETRSLTCIFWYMCKNIGCREIRICFALVHWTQSFKWTMVQNSMMRMCRCITIFSYIGSSTRKFIWSSGVWSCRGVNNSGVGLPSQVMLINKIEIEAICQTSMEWAPTHADVFHPIWQVQNADWKPAFLMPHQKLAFSQACLAVP